MKKYKIAIVGATGAVGRAMIDVLNARSFPIDSVIPIASPRSLGKKVKIQDREFACQTLKPGCFDGVDFAFFDVSDAISKEWVPEALKSGSWVIDNSGTYRMNPEIALIVPEANGHLVDVAVRSKDSQKKLFAGPNCTTIQLTVALKPLHDRFGLKRVAVSTYQAVSGAGTEAMNELREQTRASLDGSTPKATVFKHPIPFNCIPHIGSFDSEGHTSEEKKVIQETRKILNLPNLAVSCTAVRVPVLMGHSESVSIEFEKQADPKSVRECLKNAPGIQLLDSPETAVYPMNSTPEGYSIPSASGSDPVYVGRIRKDPSCENGIQMWVVADNLRKGAALNALQIAERIIDAQD